FLERARPPPCPVSVKRQASAERLTSAQRSAKRSQRRTRNERGMQRRIRSGNRVREIYSYCVAKLNPSWWGIEHKKDPGIPSTLPFKEDILAEIEQGRRQAEENKRRKEIKSQAAPVPPETSSSTAVPTITQDDSDNPPILIDSSLSTLGAVIDSVDA
ncbi:hypothetical protein FS749_014966, partial [Ceratobasidium sp. UAMH 11750]